MRGTTKNYIDLNAKGALHLLDMAKKKDSLRAKHQFLFSTTDLDFDPKRIKVVDTETGKKLRVEIMTKIVGDKKNQTFSVRMTEDNIEQISRTAKREDVSPSEFARQAIERAIQERAEDSKRIRKTKR